MGNDDEKGFKVTKRNNKIIQVSPVAMFMELYDAPKRTVNESTFVTVVSFIFWLPC